MKTKTIKPGSITINLNLFQTKLPFWCSLQIIPIFVTNMYIFVKELKARRTLALVSYYKTRFAAHLHFITQINVLSC